jgi:uncharacterized surface protein with fasciclin (FAS1) repeats
MKIRGQAVVASATGALLLAGAGLAAPAQASSAAAPSARGENSLAAVLTSGKVGFDKNHDDFDIVTAAVLAVLDAKPSSAVGVLADGSIKLTAFVPTDDAFRRLVRSISGKNLKNEKKVFNAVAGLGIDTVEAVLLYHVVPGKPITAKQALKADGARLETALGKNVRVKVTHQPAIKLRDKDRNARNARVVLASTDINKGNKQIAHGIDRVLRPLDLPKAG